MMKIEMRAATSKALEPGNRKGANSSTTTMIAMAAFSGAAPGKSSDSSHRMPKPRVRPRLVPERGASAVAPVRSGAFCAACLLKAAIACSMLLGDREQTARLPEQDQRHEQNVRAQRQFRREKTDIVAGQPHQDGADETAADRSEAADDQDDEHQNGHAVADLALDHR